MEAEVQDVGVASSHPLLHLPVGPLVLQQQQGSAWRLHPQQGPVQGSAHQQAQAQQQQADPPPRPLLHPPQQRLQVLQVVDSSSDPTHNNHVSLAMSLYSQQTNIQ